MSTPSQTVARAVELVRGLNSTGAAHDAYPVPSQVYDTYGSLSILLELLPQTINQSAGWITRETDRGGVNVVDGPYAGDPHAAAAAVEHHSGQAAAALRAALQELSEAHSITGAMAARSRRAAGRDRRPRGRGQRQGRRPGPQSRPDRHGDPALTGGGVCRSA